jgi:DNA ligase (NAD+)
MQAEEEPIEESDILELISIFNASFKTAEDMPTEVLKEVLEFSEREYYTQEEENSSRMLRDPVYDYIKDYYRARLAADHLTVPEDSQMDHVPESVGRMVVLPIWMGSCKKMNQDTGEVRIWRDKYGGPYHVSAKMDGASALYDGKKLYSRGKRNEGQNISELMKYIKFPELPPGVMVRGEVIMARSVFQSKYERKDPSETDKFSNSRNAVAGLVNKMGSNAAKGVPTPLTPLREKFIRDLKFIAYEYITPEPIRASEQFKNLDALFGVNVAKHEQVQSIDDMSLSKLYDRYIAELDFEIDGVVVCDDAVYVRPYGENPDYLRAFKKPLAVLTSRTRVTAVTWEVSKEGYLRPVVHFNPVNLNGAMTGKASGHNAGIIDKEGIGPGAVIDVIRSGGVIPKILVPVVERAEPGFPDVEYEWNESHVHIYPLVVDLRAVQIKQLHHFLDKLGTKGIGPKLMERLYDGGVDSIVKLMTVTEEKLSFIGGKTASNIVATIAENKANLTLPLLAGTCGIFGSLMGVTRFEAIFNHYPNLMDSPEVADGNTEELCKMFQQIDGFALKTAQQAAEGFEPFIEFLDELYSAGITPTVAKAKLKSPPTSSTRPSDPNKPSIKGRNVLITGFRDAGIVNFIEANGGKNLKSLTKACDLLLIKDDNTRNTKVKEAQARNIEVLTREEFATRYI